jgi:hypothetical protein
MSAAGIVIFNGPGCPQICTLAPQLILIYILPLRMHEIFSAFSKLSMLVYKIIYLSTLNNKYRNEYIRTH